MALKLAGLALWMCVVVLILMPPRFDPAIRLKEWMERQRDQETRR